ncbi:hypothetical protein D3C71_533620 [compost metagenome]
MKLNLIFAAVLLLLTVSTCTKFGKNVYVEGRVYDPITGEGIPNISLKIYRTKTNFSIGDPPPHPKILKQTTTDENGFYKMEDLADAFKKVYVQLNEEDYYLVGPNTYPVKKGKKNRVDFEIVPAGHYKLVVNNVNCQGPGDTIIISQTDQFGALPEIDRIITGCDSDGYYPYFFKMPMGTIYTQYTVKRNGVVNSYSVNFEVLPGQDNIQTINY